jgi:FG-GAP-like repeat
LFPSLRLVFVLALVGAGCNDTAIELRVVSDSLSTALDAMCLELDAGGAARFGRSYSLAARPLPQTLTALSESRSSLQAIAIGLKRALPVARDRRNVPFRSGEELHVDLALDACLPAPTDGKFSLGASAAGAVDRALLLPSVGGVGGTAVAFGGGGVTRYSASASALMREAGGLAAAPTGMVASLAALDLDGDCRGDLLVGGAAPAVWSRAANGGFPAASALAAPAGSVLAAGDVDGDGAADLIAATGGELHLYLNDGAAGFREMSGAFDTAPTAATALAVGDLDGDGALDVIVGQDGAPPRVYLADPQAAGHFVYAAAAFPPRTLHAAALALADLDGDGDLDLVLGAVGDGLFVYLNRGDGFLEDRTFDSIGSAPSGDVPGLLVTDLDGDCLPDLIAARGGAAPLYLRSAGGGKLAAGPDLGVAEIAGASAEDVDGDGRPDLLLFGASGLVLLVQQ